MLQNGVGYLSVEDVSHMGGVFMSQKAGYSPRVVDDFSDFFAFQKAFETTFQEDNITGCQIEDSNLAGGGHNSEGEERLAVYSNRYGLKVQADDWMLHVV